MRIFRWLFVMAGLVFTQDHLIHVPSIDPEIVGDTLHSILKKESDLTVEYQLESFSADTYMVTYQIINKFKVVGHKSDSIQILSCGFQVSKKRLTHFVMSKGAYW